MDTQVRTNAGISGRVLIGADGANSGIGKKLAGALPPSDMEVAFGYRAPFPANGEAPTVVAFLPKWVGYAWAFPRPDHISFGIATTQDAFEHQPLDDLLWQFMIGYYSEPSNDKRKFWRKRTDQRRQIRHHPEQSAERYAARIPGLADKTWETRKICGQTGRCSATPPVSQILSPEKESIMPSISTSFRGVLPRGNN